MRVVFEGFFSVEIENSGLGVRAKKLMQRSELGDFNGG